MANMTFSTRMLTRWAQRHWVMLTVAAVVGLLLLIGRPALAADGRYEVYQTVPPPTPPPSAGSNDDDTSSPAEAEPATSAPATGEVVAAAALAQTAATTGTVNVVALNVRQGPTTDSPVIGKLTSGMTVQVQGRNEGGDWLFVCCVPGTETSGWVSAQYISPTFTDIDLPVTTATAAPAATAPVTTPATIPTVPGTVATDGRTGTVTVVALNVRAQPTTDSAVIGKLAANTTVTVTGRNEAGDWLYVCCVPITQTTGWVSAQYIEPVFAATDLPALADDGTPVAGATAPVATPEATGPASLSLTIQQQPPYAVQSKEIALVFTVQNSGGTDATNVQLRNELPAELTYVSAGADSSGVITQEEGNAGATVVVVTWPAVGAGAQATATVRVQVAPDLANGTVFANLAVVTADNAESTSAGLTVGMPPALLPEFW